jgi:6-pyruvoyl-tetrahydropterin synthase
MTDEDGKHVHSFILKLYIRKENENFVEFNKYEKIIKEYIEKLRGNYLNYIFDETPTLEYLSLRFFEDIEEILSDTKNFTLVSLELGDSPIKSVKVGNEIIASRANLFIDSSVLD